MTFETSSNGKILFTSEYTVLKGSLALAIPTKFKQHLTFENKGNDLLIWKSYDFKNNVWFECQFLLPNLKINNCSDKKTAQTLAKILNSAKKINSNFLEKSCGGIIKTKLDFPINWGLGSSSTLINNIAKWSNTNPYELLWANFKGSGYDIACAQRNYPILFKVENNSPIVKKISFQPIFSKNLFFIHLNKKQNSNKAIKNFNAKNISLKLVNSFTDLTKKIINSNNICDFQRNIKKHEMLLSKELLIQPIKEKFFNDYDGEIKSLGAWGGDFILAAGPLNSPSYFKNKGFKTIVSFKNMFY